MLLVVRRIVVNSIEVIKSLSGSFSKSVYLLLASLIFCNLLHAQSNSVLPVAARTSASQAFNQGQGGVLSSAPSTKLSACDLQLNNQPSACSRTCADSFSSYLTGGTSSGRSCSKQCVVQFALVEACRTDNQDIQKKCAATCDSDFGGQQKNVCNSFCDLAGINNRKNFCVGLKDECRNFNKPGMEQSWLVCVSLTHAMGCL